MYLQFEYILYLKSVSYRLFKIVWTDEEFVFKRVLVVN